MQRCGPAALRPWCGSAEAARLCGHFHRLFPPLQASTGYVPCFGFPPGFKEHISLPERLGLAMLLVAMVVTSWLGPSSEFTDSYQSWQVECCALRKSAVVVVVVVVVVVAPTATRAGR